MLMKICWLHHRQKSYGKKWVSPVTIPQKKTLIDQVYSTIPWPSQNIQVSLVPIYSSYYEAISIQNTQCDK